MLVPAIPDNETTRLETLQSLHILDSVPEERFDALTRLAQQLFAVPYAAITFIDAERQWLKSGAGLSFSETSRDTSFCAHTILSDTPLIVPDVRDDERFHDNPFVVGEPGIRFYAGAPLKMANGSLVGTFCLLDVNVRSLSEVECGHLQTLAATVASLVEGEAVKTQLHRERTRLRASEGLLAMAIEGSGTGIWDRDILSGRITYSAVWKALLGYADHELSDLLEDTLARVHPDDLPYVQASMQAHVDRKSESFEANHRIRCKDGSYKWISSRGKVVSRDADGRALRMIGTTTDISNIRKISEKLQETVDLVTSLTNEVPGLVFQTQLAPDGTMFFSYASAGISDIYELMPDQVARSDALIHDLIHPDDRQAYRTSLTISAASLSPWNLEYRVNLPRQGLRWRQGAAHPRRLLNGSVLWHGFITDVTERKHIEAELQEFATVDYLTQLPNRRHFMIQIKDELRRIHQGEVCEAAVLMCDLDYFKSINDSWGHAIGDNALKHFAAILREEVEDWDAVGRIGGEEFVAILREADLESAMVRAKRIQARVARTPLRERDREIWLTVSIGITVMNDADLNADIALSRSDMALYRAKSNGRNRIESLLPGNCTDS